MNIIKNFIYNSTYQLLLVILPLVTAPYISRVLGANGLGEYTYSQSIAYYFVLIIMLGLNNYGTRTIATVRDDKKKLSKTFTSIYLMQFFISIVVFMIYIYYTLNFKDNNTIFLLQGFYVLSAMFDVNWLFFGLEKFKITVTRNIVIKVIATVLIFIFVKRREDIFIYTIILSISFLISQVSIWPFVFKYTSFTKVGFKSVISHVKPNIILFIPTIAISIYRVMDKVMIGYLSNFNEVAYFENSEKFIMVSLGFINSLGAVMLPAMSNIISKNEKEKINKYLSISMQIVMLIVSAMAFGLAGISNEFIPVFYGNEFRESINILKVLSISMFFIGWANVIRTQYLLPNKMDKLYMKSVCTGAFINFSLNIFFIREFGAVGASVSTVITEASVAIIQTYMIRKEIDLKSYIKKSIFYLISGLVMFFVIRVIGYTLGISIKTVVIQVILGGVVYLILSIAYLIVTKNEIIKLALSKYKKFSERLSR